MGSCSLEAALPRALQRFSLVGLAAPIALGEAVQPEQLSRAAELGEHHLLRLSRSEAHRGACRNIEMHAEALLPVEIKRLVGFEEMIVAADLNRPVAGIDHLQRRLAPPGIELDIAVVGDDLSRNHLISGLALAWADGVVDGHEL